MHTTIYVSSYYRFIALLASKRCMFVVDTISEIPRIFSRRSSVIFFFLFEMLAAVRIVSIRQHRSA